MCPVIEDLAAAVAAVPGLPTPSGLGADVVLAEQLSALTGAVVVLQRELSLRMAELEVASGGTSDVRGDAVRGGLGRAQATRLRQMGVFAAEYSAVCAAWSSGAISCDQVAALRGGAGRLPTPQLREELMAQVLPHLPGLDARSSRRLVDFAVDGLDPGDPDLQEQSDHAARHLAWAKTPGGGVAFEGYLPAAEADAFVRAVEALAQGLRVQGDGLSAGQRRADALAALVAIAADRGLPAGGGLPAAVTLTVSLTEAERIAQRDPADFATLFERRPAGGALIGGRPAGDAVVRFGLCCGAVTPVLAEPPERGSPLARIAATKVEPLAVGRAIRLATPAQRKALLLRDGGCAIDGCAVAAAYTQPHHVTPWAVDGKTDLDNLVSLCFVHHRQVELGRFVFVPRRPDQARPDGALEHARWWIFPPSC